jgi:Retrotransposon gag protein
MMCLSYMKGPKVNDWVWHKAQTLQAAIDNRTMVATDETIWQAFEDEFVAAFTDTTRHEQAMLDLINISMMGDDLDTYMATFEHLRERAGWEADAQGTILMFQRGLKALLVRAIVERTHPWPATLQAWYTATHTQHVAYAKNKVTLTNLFIRNDNCLRWEQALGGQGGRQGGGGRRRDDDAMDVDVVRTNPLSDEERKCLQAEGRCFFCKAQGHVLKGCPKKKNRLQGGGINAKPAQLRAWTMEAGEPADDAAPTKDALQMIKGMNEEERTKLLDSLILEGSDFWQAQPAQPGHELCDWINCILATRRL